MVCDNDIYDFSGRSQDAPLSSSTKPIADCCCSAAKTRVPRTLPGNLRAHTVALAGMDLQHSRRGSGPPLLLVHGLGSTRRAWSLIGRAIEEQREVIALDLPGHGATPAEADSGTFAGLARSLEAWLAAQGLTGVDMIGSSLGGRLVLEMARRGKAGAVVALDPGGFWEGWSATSSSPA
jgi:pimeloyl-ACP methyl ester carboxylesterase